MAYCHGSSRGHANAPAGRAATGTIKRRRRLPARTPSLVIGKMSDPTSDRFRVTTGELLGRQVISLADWNAETQAILVPEYGFPCIAFRLRTADGPWHVLSEPPDLESFQ